MFEAGDPGLHLIHAIPASQHACYDRCLVSENLPLLVLKAVLLSRLQDLDDPFAGDRRPPTQPPQGGAFRLRLFSQADEFRVAHRDRRQVKAIGLDDAALGVAPPVTLAIRAVLHRDETGLDQGTVQPLCLRLGETECLLLHRRRRPHDRVPSPLPILRLRKPEQPVDRMHQARRDADARRRCLQRREQPSR
jgi:hypothetical protein